MNVCTCVCTSENHRKNRAGLISPKFCLHVGFYPGSDHRHKKKILTGVGTDDDMPMLPKGAGVSGNKLANINPG